MQVSRLVSRTAALVVPAALVLGATGSAFAAKPPRTPAPQVTSTPAKASASKSATFVWTTVAGTAYTCSLDGSGYSTCSSPKTYSNLTDRTHTFAMKARATGKAASYSYGWTVDTLAPAAPVVSPVAGPTSNTSASISFTDSDTGVTGFTCSLDGSVTACTSPQAYSALSEGLHTVVVTAHDAAGNTASGSVGWTVDHTAPNIPVVTGPADPTDNPDASVAFSGEEGATFTCALDAEAAAPCSSPWTRAGLSDGSHTLSVTALDGAGNRATGSVSWVVDTVAPGVPALVSSPATPTNDPAFTVRFADTDLSTATYVCTFGGVAAACTSPFVPVVTPMNGPYAVEVRAVDLAGNQSSPLTASWTFDNAAPSPAAFISGPGLPTNVTDPSFDFTDTDTTTDHFTCSLDGVAVGLCVPGLLSAIAPGATLADGQHTLSVQAVDAASNASAAVDWNWVLDTAGPVQQPNVPQGVNLVSGPVTSTPTFVFTNPDPTTIVGFVCSLDGGAWTTCASGFMPVVGDGAHTLQVATVDQANNIGTPITYTWTLDTTAPQGVITFPTTLAGAVKVTFAETVLGATGSTARLLLAGTTTAVATNLSCLGASGTVVSCASAVQAVVLTPVARLVPGQKYRLAVTGAVHDAAGNAAVVPTTVYRALRVLQESDLSAVQAWAPKASTAAYGSRYVVAHLAGAQASYAFRGTSITWYTATGPAMGTARVYCGSTLKATVNNYAAAAKWHVARTVRCSSSTTTNTLRIVATGLRGSSLGKGTGVVVDAVKVGTTLTSNPAAVQRWATAASSLASGGRYGLADQANESATLRFRGTSVTWRTLLGKGMGKAKVYVDGVYKGTFDQFATTTKAASRVWKLTDTVHTIKVVATGTRRTGATGTRVVLDSLTVG